MACDAGDADAGAIQQALQQWSAKCLRPEGYAFWLLSPDQAALMHTSPPCTLEQAVQAVCQLLRLAQHELLRLVCCPGSEKNLAAVSGTSNCLHAHASATILQTSGMPGCSLGANACVMIAVSQPAQIHLDCMQHLQVPVRARASSYRGCPARQATSCCSPFPASKPAISLAGKQLPGECTTFSSAPSQL